MKSKNHDHYVQQRYLKHFAIDSSKKTHIFAYDKTKDIVHKLPIDKTSCENGFYDVDLTKYSKEIEMYNYNVNATVLDELKNKSSLIKETDALLSKYVEPLFAIIEKVICRYKGRAPIINPCPLESDEEKAQIAYYITYQYLRTKKYRESFAEKVVSSEIRDTLNFDDIVGIPKETKRAMQASLLLNFPVIESIAKVMFSGKWYFGTNNTQNLFLTSDHPVIVKQDPSSNAIFDKVERIIYPLTPNLILIIYPNSRKSVEGLQDNMFYPVQYNQIHHLNLLQINHSSNFIYSNSDKLLESVTTIMLNNK